MTAMDGLPPRPTPPTRTHHFSLLLVGVGGRLAGATFILAALWLAVAWGLGR